MRNTKDLILKALSPYDEYSEGYGNTGSSGNSYVLGFHLGTASVKTEFSHIGSIMLDEINAFDLAETKGPYIGQINMSTVSSFCGPQGLVLGYDIMQPKNLYKESYGKVEFKGTKAMVYSLEPLIDATEKMFGTVDKRVFPLRPGSHVPFANKTIKADEPCIIFSCMAIGIAEDREKDACLLMEDVGKIENKGLGPYIQFKEEIIEKLAKSVLAIGHNQRVKYKEIFAGIRFQVVKKGEVGCALVAAPYFTLARNSLSKFNLLP